jgi:hypothetical protein
MLSVLKYFDRMAISSFAFNNFYPWSRMVVMSAIYNPGTPHNKYLLIFKKHPCQLLTDTTITDLCQEEQRLLTICKLIAKNLYQILKHKVKQDMVKNLAHGPLTVHKFSKKTNKKEVLTRLRWINCLDFPLGHRQSKILSSVQR